ncbi:MAG: N-acetylmuramoyl-L-alanine amidase [Bacillota bacterium]|nr:N-acetylmuramoyl-L-alanine amidase [Bacillota bacterium]
MIEIKGIRFGIFGNTEKYSRIVVDGNNFFKQYQVQTLTNPDRIFVDIYNSKLDTSQREIPVNDGLVKQIRMAQNRPGVIRVVADLERKANHGVFTLNQAGSYPYRLVLDILRSQEQADRPPMEELPPSSKLVVIDPGHGGGDPGAIGIDGIQEKEVNLAIALMLRDLLKQKNIEVSLTRTDDRTLSLAERVRHINGLETMAAISIHCNSFNSASANGIETFYHSKKQEAKALATLVQNSLIKAFGWTNRGVKTGNYYMVRETKLKEIVLPEIGFLTNDKEGRAMAKKENRTKAAEALAKGIVEFLKDK